MSFLGSKSKKDESHSLQEVKEALNFNATKAPKVGSISNASINSKGVYKWMWHASILIVTEV